MRRIALTGGIATGKSYVARRLTAAGVPVVDADVLSRQAVAPGEPGLEAIVALFGPSVLTSDGLLDRGRLGDHVFRDAGARRDLEAIVHPIVQRRTEAFFAALPPETSFAVADIPLLFETGGEGRFEAVIVVACEPAAQIERIIARDGLDHAAAQRRVAAQWPIADKIARADYVISTDGTYAETDAQVDALLEVLRQQGSSPDGDS